MINIGIATNPFWVWGRGRTISKQSFQSFQRDLNVSECLYLRSSVQVLQQQLQLGESSFKTRLMLHTLVLSLEDIVRLKHYDNT